MIRTILVDDEKPSTSVLKRLLINSGKVEVDGCFSQPKELLNFLSKNSIDVVFLDVKGAEFDGLKLASQIKNKCEVVFVTAYKEYAVEAFHINALDYLLKPVSKERLGETIERIVKKLNIIVKPSKVEVKYFGRFKITINNTEVKFRTKKAEELIAFLFERRGKSLSRNLIIDCLWRDFDGDKALINFNTTLYYVRKALLHYGVDLPILYEDGSYRVGDHNIECDYFALMDCEVGEKKITHENIAHYRGIAALYTGSYLEANDYTWAEVNRLNSKEKYIQLLLYIASYYVEQKKNGEAIEFLKTGFSLDPLDGKIIYNLIKVLLAEGRQSIAEEYYKYHKDAQLKAFHREPDESMEWLILGHEGI